MSIFSHENLYKKKISTTYEACEGHKTITNIKRTSKNLLPKQDFLLFFVRRIYNLVLKTFNKKKYIDLQIFLNTFLKIFFSFSSSFDEDCASLLVNSIGNKKQLSISVAATMCQMLLPY